MNIPSRCPPSYDVLFEICRYLWPQSDTQYWHENAQDRWDVVAMTRTCRAFYEPAMDVLWHSIPDISPVIRTMPAELWEEYCVVPQDEHIGAMQIMTTVSVFLRL